MNFSFCFVLFWVTKCVDFTQSFVKREEFYRRFVYSYVNLFKSQHSKAEKGGESDAPKKPKAVGPQQAALGPKAAGGISISSSEDEDLVDSKRKRLELAWLPKVLESALQLCRWALPTPAGTPVRIPSCKLE